MLAVHRRRRVDRADPALPMKANGSGDVTAALFTAHLLSTGDAGGGPGPHGLAASSTCCRTPSTRASASCSCAVPGEHRPPADAVRGHAGPLTLRPRLAGASGSGGVGTGQKTTRSSRWTTSRSYPGPSSRARSWVVRPEQPGQLARGVVDQPAADHRARRAGTASTGSPSPKAPSTPVIAGRQQRRAALDHRADRALVEQQPPARGGRVRQPQLAGRRGASRSGANTVPTSSPARRLASLVRAGEHGR